jgi:nitrite reductase/ring-hydroxylating ferredoxin subunit
MTWVRVVRVRDLNPAAAVRVTHDGRAICVALADGEPRAIDDICPHRETALSGGLVTDGVITCPGHFRRFDLRTGRCVGRPWEQVRRYECAVEDGWVVVDIGPVFPSRSLRDLLLAHARGLDIS